MAGLKFKIQRRFLLSTLIIISISVLIWLIASKLYFDYADRMGLYHQELRSGGTLELTKAHLVDSLSELVEHAVLMKTHSKLEATDGNQEALATGFRLLCQHDASYLWVALYAEDGTEHLRMNCRQEENIDIQLLFARYQNNPKLWDNNFQYSFYFDAQQYPSSDSESMYSVITLYLRIRGVNDEPLIIIVATQLDQLIEHAHYLKNVGNHLRGKDEAHSSKPERAEPHRKIDDYSHNQSGVMGAFHNYKVPEPPAIYLFSDEDKLLALNSDVPGFGKFTADGLLQCCANTHELISRLDSGSSYEEGGVWLFQSINPYEEIRSSFDVYDVELNAVDPVSWQLMLWAPEPQHSSVMFAGLELRYVYVLTGMVLTALLGCFLALLYFRQLHARDESEEKDRRLATVFSNMKDGIVACDERGAIIFVNPAMLEMLNYSEDQLVGQSLFTLIPVSSHDSHKGYMQTFFASGLAPGKIMRNEVVMLDHVGNEIRVETSIQPMELDGQPLAVVFLRDITAQVQAQNEIKTLQIKYFQREKMAEIGMLLGGILHEVKNPIASIHGILELMAMDPEASLGSHAELMALMNDQLERVVTICQDISGFMVPKPGEQTLFDINALASNTVKLTRYDKRGRGVNIQLDLDKTVPALAGYEDQLMQVILNLIINALDALHESPKAVKQVIVSTRACGNECLLTVTDNAEGIPVSVMPKIFDSFFSSKQDDRGTGLGLSLCQEIIVNHRGTITVESVEKEGTKMIVHLPLCDQDSLVEEN